MKKNKLFSKSIAAAAISVVSLLPLTAISGAKSQAAIVRNDATVYKVYVATTVYNNYENGLATGQVLPANSSWKIIKTAYDQRGNKWYDLGKNQWVKVVTPNTKVTDSYRYRGQRYNIYGNYQQRQNNVNTQAQTYTTPARNNSVSTVGGSEASAKAWIAGRESGGSYSARNGQYIGKYQLSARYLHGDYSPANQERTADQYVRSRYGSWAQAKTYWQIHGWY